VCPKSQLKGVCEMFDPDEVRNMVTRLRNAVDLPRIHGRMKRKESDLHDAVTDAIDGLCDSIEGERTLLVELLTDPDALAKRVQKKLIENDIAMGQDALAEFLAAETPPAK
jgi:hypothetical protein